MNKKCSKCGEVKDVSEFYKDGYRPDGLCCRCKTCNKLYYDSNREHLLLGCKKYNINNKKSISDYGKKYYEENKDRISSRHRQYYVDNVTTIQSSNKKYREDNKEKIHKQKKVYCANNRKKIREHKKEYYTNNIDAIKQRRIDNAKYYLYYDKLTIDESPRLSVDGVSLEAKCKYCGAYFIPNGLQVVSRVQALNSTSLGDAFIYCSDNCKEACPIYRKHKYPAGFKHTTSREVNPMIRQMCFEEDDWECQKCGKSGKDVSLHCHHILGYAKHPQLGNDIENVITLCKECHKNIHSHIGCRYVDLQKNCPIDD